MRKVNLRNVDPAIDDPDASTWCTSQSLSSCLDLWRVPNIFLQIKYSPPDPEPPFATRGRRQLQATRAASPAQAAEEARARAIADPAPTLRAHANTAQPHRALLQHARIARAHRSIAWVLSARTLPASGAERVGRRRRVPAQRVAAAHSPV